ncbi:ATP-dependent Clp protease proteolytic subunit [Microbulbifer mangrovi]|uniref:ATP-dependent Clp protease proteolytic subunit n=1 Tax=Microbulbifer mangrovi TaxID=927787 RepID=UPI0009908E1D|nr:ATP-dependent Clp protease proteolytic subunit [Microbulbifer mangrovi]
MTISRKVSAIVLAITGVIFLNVSMAHSQLDVRENDIQAEDAVQRCMQWFAGRKFSLDIGDYPDFSIKEISGGYCIDGVIGDNSHLKALSLIEKKGRTNPIFVIRSPGGDVLASMKIAEAIMQLDSTVVAVDVCASSCANYLMLAGKRRVVYEDALLLFHGSSRYRDVRRILEFNGAAVSDYVGSSDSVVLRSAKEAFSVIDRQEKILLRAGVKSYFFYWMETFYRMTDEERREYCPVDSTLILFSPDILKKFDYNFLGYFGPISQEEVDAVYSGQGRRHKICFWDRDVL